MNEAAKPHYEGISGSTASAARHYVNNINLSFTLSEVRIDFGQEFANSDTVQSQCRLVTSPVHLRRMGQEISATISSYETRFGTIPQSESSDEESGAAEDSNG